MRKKSAHAAGLLNDTRCQVVALADLNIDAAQDMNRDYAFGGELYTDYKALLNRHRPDVIVTSFCSGHTWPI